jgi:hypothetical protein
LEVSLELETFYFEYPSLTALANIMRETVGQALEYHEYDLLRSSGMEYIDDFTLVSARKLQHWTNIPADKIRALYRCAEMMIREFHGKKIEEIEEIREFRAAGCPRA